MLTGYSGCGRWKVAKGRRCKRKEQTFALVGKKGIGETRSHSSPTRWGDPLRCLFDLCFNPFTEVALSDQQIVPCLEI